jgi:hypothetical protein
LAWAVRRGDLWHPDLSPARLPGGGALLRIDPGGPDDPDRLIGACMAPQRGEVSP